MSCTPIRRGLLGWFQVKETRRTFVSLVHELEQLVCYGLQELPVGFEEPWVLPDNVHDVGGDDSLIVFAPLHLCQAQEILDDGDKEPFLDVLIYEGVQVCRFPKHPTTTYS